MGGPLRGDLTVKESLTYLHMLTNDHDVDEDIPEAEDTDAKRALQMMMVRTIGRLPFVPPYPRQQHEAIDDISQFTNVVIEKLNTHRNTKAQVRNLIALRESLEREHVRNGGSQVP